MPFLLFPFESDAVQAQRIAEEIRQGLMAHDSHLAVRWTFSDLYRVVAFASLPLAGNHEMNSFSQRSEHWQRQPQRLVWHLCPYSFGIVV